MEKLKRNRVLQSSDWTINDCITNLSLLGIEMENLDIIFVYICSTRLPENILGLWEQFQRPNSCLPKWSSMKEFLTARYRTLANSRTRSSPWETRRFRSFGTAVTSTIPPKKCPLCSDNHPIRMCSKFLSMSITERINVAKRNKICTNC